MRKEEVAAFQQKHQPDSMTQFDSETFQSKGAKNQERVFFNGTWQHSQTIALI